MAVLLRVGGQLALGEGAGFPATVKGVREQVTPDNRLRQHLVQSVECASGHLIRSPPHVNWAGRASGSGHNQGVLTLVWFIVGGLVGWGAAHGGPAVQRAWPVFLRVQILATSATLSLVAAWRLTSVSQLLGPLALSAGMWLLLGATLVSRGERSAGQSSLEAWAVTPNASFWVVPTAAAFAGSAGTMIAVLANVITTAWNAVAVHLMRRDAPFRAASLHHLGRPVPGPGLPGRAPAPPLRCRPRPGPPTCLTLAGPLLAFSGAALFTGSVIHPHNLAVPRTGARRCGAGAG